MKAVVFICISTVFVLVLLKNSSATLTNRFAVQLLLKLKRERDSDTGGTWGAGCTNIKCCPNKRCYPSLLYRVKQCQCAPRCGGNCRNCVGVLQCRACWKDYQLVQVRHNSIVYNVCEKIEPVETTTALVTATTQETTTITCDPNCDPAIGCADNGAGKCDGNCTKDFGPTTTFTCERCDQYCVTAGCNVTGGGRCDGPCDVGYGIIASNMTCAACDPNCDPAIGCAVNGAGKCDGNCTKDFGPTTSQTCGACDPNCATLNDTSLATGCNVYNATKCDDYCKANFFVNPNTHFCSGCDPTCAPTIPGSCTTPGTCTTGCQAGSFLNPNTNLCQGCHPKCAGSCSAANKCDGNCTVNTVYDSATQTCLDCDPECANGCTSLGTCNGICNPGFGIASDNTCKPCAEHCNTTASGCNTKGPNKCDSLCNIGYALDTSTYSGTYTCQACQDTTMCSPSTDCSSTGPDTCGSADCQPGYIYFASSASCM